MSTIIKPPDFGAPGEIKERLRPLEWVATVTAAALFVAIIVFLIWGVHDWARIGVPLASASASDQSPMIANFKALSDIESERVSKILDLAVTKTLLPVFTTVIGYLLGKREG